MSPLLDVSPPISTFAAATVLLKVAELEGDVRVARLEGQLKEQRGSGSERSADWGGAKGRWRKAA